MSEAFVLQKKAKKSPEQVIDQCPVIATTLFKLSPAETILDL